MLRAGDCPSVEVLERFVARDVRPDLRESVELHCDGCDDCRSRVAQITTNFALLARIKQRLDPNGTRHQPVIAGIRILREIGRGGMGVVYEAEQSNPRRRVALKVVRGAQIADARSHALFQREIEALARLSHPHIAALHAAGATDDGDPYFAMEFVDGVSLDAYVRTRAPTLAERVDLLTRLASAVHHAHQRSVVHRDLKPANVLIDSNGAPKILDFGLAKILDEERVAGASQSLAGSVRGTLAYMSPEQARGDPAAIDARSDVYTLGVMLYELVALRLPYDVGGKDVLGAARVVCEQEPVALGRLERAARGDLEAIAACALHKDADARYASAAALAEDLERWRTGDPVLARAQGAGYLLAKLARRHRLAVGFALTILALLAGFGVWMNVLYRRADTLRIAAQESAADARRLGDVARTNLERIQAEVEKAHWTLRFYGRVFREANSSFERENVRVIDLLDAMERVLDSDSERPPIVALSIAASLAGIHVSMGRFDRAETRLRTGLAAAERAGKGRTMDAASAHGLLVAVLLSAGRIDEAERELELANAIFAEASADEPYYENVRLLLAHQRGIAAHARGRTGEAAQLLRRALEDMRATLQRDEPLFRDCLSWLVIALNDSGDYAQAVPLAQEAVELETALGGATHRQTIRARTSLAISMYGVGQGAEALEVAAQAYDDCRSVAEPDDKDRLALTNVLAGMRWKLGQRDGCIPLFREVCAAQARTLGASHAATLTTQSNLAKALFLTGAGAEADGIYREVFTRAQAALGAGHPITLRARVGLARGQFAAQNFEAAERELQLAWSGFEALSTARPDHVQEVAEVFAELYEAWQRPEDARPWRERASR